MSFFDTTIPADSEGVKLGAQRIREMKTSLNSLIGQIFTDLGAFLPKWVTGAQIANDASVDGNRAISSDHIKNGAAITRTLPDGVLSADSTGRAKTADGYFSADTTGRNKFANGIWTLAKLAWASFFTDAPAKLFPVDADLVLIGDSAAANAAKQVTLGQIRTMDSATVEGATPIPKNTAYSLTHFLSGVPRSVRWVLVCLTSELGYGVGEEVDVLGARDASNSNSQASSSADATRVWLTIGPHNWAILDKTTFTQAAITTANWKLRVYVSL